jgi:hypothetical protein
LRIVGGYVFYPSTAAAQAEGAVAEAEVAAGAEAIRRKENGTASSTRRTTTQFKLLPRQENI